MVYKTIYLVYPCLEYVRLWCRCQKPEDPFVHICGKHYVDRVEDVTKVTVYSNLSEVELFVNGESLGRQTSDVHFFYFDVPNKGESVLKAVAGECSDESCIRKTEVFNDAYRLKERGADACTECAAESDSEAAEIIISNST